MADSISNREPLPAEAVATIQALYDRGLMLQAYRAAEPLGPLHHWRGKEAVTLAIRLAAHWGAPRLAGALSWRAWRVDPHDPNLAAYYAHALLHRRGPLFAWEFLQRLGDPSPEATSDSLMHFFTVCAMTAADLRDFESARQWLTKAGRIVDVHPWIAVTEAHILEQEDRYEESLLAARRSLEISPWYRPGVQALAHAMQLLDRDGEALALLEEAEQHFEHFQVTRQLACLQIECGQFETAGSTLDRAEQEAPLLEKAEKEWLLRQRMILASRRGATAEAVSLARVIDDFDCRELVSRAESGCGHNQVRLDVPFIRQHHLTCAPATLSAIARFWGQDVDHLEVVEEICYDGTSAHSERRWAQTNGWRVREFTVSWEAAVNLLDRGVPFTLTTSEAASAHLQAVVGYDELRRSLCIRDPYVYSTNDFSVEPMLRRYRASGPRGMAMVPDSHAALLDQLELPDASLYDRLFELHGALDDHRRADAGHRCAAMAAEFPSHRLTLTARRSLATYDGDTIALLACLDELLLQYPEDGNLNLAKLACLRELARRADRLALLEQRVVQRGVDPVFWGQYAQELRADAREIAAAESWVKWALRYQPLDPELIRTRADLLWDRQQFEEAARYYRIAACLADRREPFSRSYFTALRHLRKTDAGLQFLAARNKRLGGASADPTVTWIEALQQVGHTTEATAELDAALARRPADSQLRLFATDFLGRCGRFAEAEACLCEARDQTAAPAWHRAAASLAELRIEKAAALQHWRSVLAVEPLAHDAIRSIAELLAETEDRSAAAHFLDQLCERFPFSCPLLIRWIEWLKSEESPRILPALRQLLEVNPANSWAWCELAIQLDAGGQPAEAMQAAEEGIRVEPHRPEGYCTRAGLFLGRGQIEVARADLREAIRLEVDNGYAITHYVGTARSLAERQQALEEVAGELRRQVIFRDALFAYRDAARGLLSPSVVLGLLREAHAARPDLWQSWSVLIQQLVDIGEHGEALELARQATQRFPLLPRLWVDLARVEQVQLNPAGEIAALERALELSPAWTFASRQLAALHERQNELDRAKTVLERAIAAAPLEAANHGCLAQILWTLGDRTTALARVQHAATLDLDYDWAWSALKGWAVELEQPCLAAETARDLARRQAGDVRSWLLLANVLTPEEGLDEIMTALERALALNGRCLEAFDRRAQTLALVDCFDEALAQCEPPVFTVSPPKLRLRAAWIEAQRGNLVQAVARARSALADHPDFYVGWQMLADWLLQLGQGNEAVLAAGKMSALAPNEPLPLGYLGDLKHRLGDPDGAKAAFRRAFALDPGYEYAGFELLQLQLAAKELEPARQTLAALSRRGDTHRTLAAAVQLASAHGDCLQAQERFGQLCENKGVEETDVAQAVGALERCFSRTRLDRYLLSRVSGSDVSPALAVVWVQRQTAKWRWRLHSPMAALPDEGGVRRAAVMRYLDRIGAAFDKARREQDLVGPPRIRFHFRRLMRNHGRWLHEDDEGWGQVGYVLTIFGRPGPVVKWLADWKQRPKVESWMLYNLVIMLRRLKRHDEARNVIRHAVHLRHRPELFKIFTTWAAFEEALEGNFAKAEQYLAQLPAANAYAAQQPIQTMTELLVSLERGMKNNQQLRFKTIRTLLGSAFRLQRPYLSASDVRHGYCRLLRVLSAQSNGRKLRLWGFWFYRGADWAWLPILIVLGPIALLAPPLWLIWWACYRRFRPAP